MLKMQVTSDAAPDAELCLPTHQVFDFPAEVARPPTPPSRSPSVSADVNLSTAMAEDSCSVGSKRSASPAPSMNKKRAVGERISSKDFIPPDVSGLSKREARLVKNRAAAFLSRQRKREEFECMEVRVAELEQENARLLALTQNGSSISPPQQPQSDTQLVSEVELLKAQLAAAEERERTLSAQLASTTPSTPSQPAIKLEATEPLFSALSASPSRTTPSTVSSPNKSGASLGLMVLLCALPSLLSMRMQSTSAPTSFAIPNPFPASYDYSSSAFDWTKATGSGSLMDLDSDHHLKSLRKLEFTGIDSSEMGAALGDLDISFDTTPSDDGKIRVRIHPSSSASSRAASPASDGMGSDMSSSSSPVSSSSSSSLAMWSGPESTSKSSLFTTSSSDPFLGVVSSSSDYGMSYASDSSMYGNMDLGMGMSSLNFGEMSSDSFGLGGSASEYSIPDSTSSSGKRRVRIALKSMPQAGGEGGEWEVQIC